MFGELIDTTCDDRDAKKHRVAMTILESVSASSNDIILGTLINYEYSGDLSLSSITSSKHGSTIKYSISLRIFFQFTYFIYQHQILFFYFKIFSFPFQVAQGDLMNLLIGYLIVSNRCK